MLSCSTDIPSSLGTLLLSSFSHPLSVRIFSKHLGVLEKMLRLGHAAGRVGERTWVYCLDSFLALVVLVTQIKA